jgi:intracellular multiplication protein IcmD
MADTSSLGSIATSVTSNFEGLAKLVTASSYVAGLGFGVASIVKFKGHKDNPTQIPISTPEALTAVSAALTYLPDVVAEAGRTTFGQGSEAIATAASSAGVTSSDVSAAESAVKEKLSG